MAKKLSPIEQRASSKVLNDLRGEAQKLMKGKMSNLKKVTVASDSKEGLKKGLDKAEEIIKGDEYSEDEACPECDCLPCECTEEDLESAKPQKPFPSAYKETDGDDDEVENMSEAEIDAKIQELLALKEKKK